MTRSTTELEAIMHALIANSENDGVEFKAVGDPKTLTGLKRSLRTTN